MMKYRVTFNNIAGELDHRDVRIYPTDVHTEGVPYGELIRCIREMVDGAPFHDGDSITIKLID